MTHTFALRQGLLALVFAFALMLTACRADTGADAAGKSLAEGTNKSFSHTVTTSAPASVIWQRWTTPGTWGEWDLGLKSAELEGAFIVGAKGTLQPLSGQASQFEVTAVDPGKSCTFETALPGARLIVTRTIVSEAPTVFRHDVSFAGPMAGVWASQFGPGFRTALPPTLEKLKSLAESESP